MTESAPFHARLHRRRSRLFALIPCAGSGSRAGTAQPKQYQVIAGQPMVAAYAGRFQCAVARLTGCLVVVAPSDGSVLNVDDQRTVVVPCGGATRAESVLNGLEHLLAHGCSSAGLGAGARCGALPRDTGADQCA
jgi:2-C-methyl-D-erythritol 4-phosphate cytidylyltransferase